MHLHSHCFRMRIWQACSLASGLPHGLDQSHPELHSMALHKAAELQKVVQGQLYKVALQVQ